MILDERNKMARRAAEEIADGMVVNLGIGIPSLVPNHLPSSMNVMFQAENGILGMGASPLSGKEDENLCNAGGYPVTIVPGASYFDSTTAFGMIRRGRVDVSILGSLQVSRQGDLANWIIPGKKIPGMGGAMELASKAKKLVVLMKHTDKAGKSKIVKECTLPLTSKGCVDLIITDLAVFQVVNKELFLIEHYSSTTVELIREKTDCNFLIGNNLKTIAY
ncbi:6-acetamido-3-oxohexanoate:acetyl-CoA CoA transferase beta subunit [Mesobacillus persicus]|uniref:6-acetamido-3-oxohexanoate:acetyl-CoA CoA transferase beta subunit n=1 Tax=Mesobacillus persicus TaxID=930146 RepID=A0A1H8BGL5_9BACI|nr:3-oxoacid CoA-transferase subunit B [Mesobacillus persicus]SEM81284.1 6-acetamido-3-oxohexanoate:acetyl-CoA CoA transferase beta subunit [Mesobacillus persicus]